MASLVQVAALSADWYEPAHEAHAKGSPRSIPQRCRSAVAHSESVLMLLCLLLLVVSAAAAPTTSAACTASARATISRALAQVQAGLLATALDALPQRINIIPYENRLQGPCPAESSDRAAAVPLRFADGPRD